jgi:type II secretory pathway pseudopilin PulG
MRGLAAGAVMAFLALSTLAAYAQNPAQEAIDKQKKDAAAEAERAYQRALKDTASSAPAAKVDPWGNVRAADPAQPKQNSQPK